MGPSRISEPMISPRAVEAGDLDALLRHATGSAPPGPAPSWGIVVLRAPASREALIAFVRQGAGEMAALRRPCPPGEDPAAHARWCAQRARAEVASMVDAPVWLCPVLTLEARVSVPHGAHALALGMECVALTAEAMGMRTIRTIRHLRHEAGVRTLLGLPAGTTPDLAVALGFPEGGEGVPEPGILPAPPSGPRPPVYLEGFGLAAPDRSTGSCRGRGRSGVAPAPAPLRRDRHPFR